MTRRSPWLGVAFALLLAWGVAGRADAQTINVPESVAQLGDPIVAYRTGRYDDAIKVLQAVPRADSTWTIAQVYLARTLETVGRYDDAERVARTAALTPDGKNVWNTYGEVLLARGKRAPAESAFMHSLAVHALDSLTARLNLAVLAYERGDRKQALDAFDSFIDVYNNNGSSLTSAEVTDVAVAVDYLSVRDPQLAKDALTAFDRALGLDSDNLDAKVQLAELFLEKYNRSDAQTEFEEILRANPRFPRALVGSARRLAADDQPGADSLVTEALKVNPDYVPALLFRAEVKVGSEDYTGATTDIDHALRIDPTSSDGLALLAATQYLTGNRAAYETTRQRAMALDPHDGEFYLAMSNMTADVRLYDTSVDFARQAIAADSMNWTAYGKLGLELFHTGNVPDAKQYLDKSFAGDPYNVLVKNTLDLIDTFKDYDETTTPHYRFILDKDESGILGVYMGDLAESAYKTFSAQFGYEPPTPVRVEVFRSHADFSVRAVGLTGIGALGVSFGTTSAFISPAAKDMGPFNWGSTMWHELAHTFTLGMTDHRIPRWLSEGLSVWEEQHARPGWGMGVTAPFLVAFKNGKLYPPSQLNDGFMAPQYPDQVEHSYYEASLVCDFILRDHGDTSIVAMLHAYKDGLTTTQVFQKVLHTDLKTFDQKFADYLKDRFRGPLAALARDSSSMDPGMSNEELVRRAEMGEHESYISQLIAGRILLERGDTAAAIGPLDHAVELFPDDAVPDAPSSFLVRIYTARKDAGHLIPLLKKHMLLDDTDYGADVLLDSLLETTGDSAGAADALERAMYVNPFDIAAHQKLADLFKGLGDKQKVVRERRAVVALKPADAASAWYRLAVAYVDAGDSASAKRSVLRSLEEAPNYQLAQELLLKLHGE